MIEEIIYYTPDQIRKIRRKIGLTQAKFGKGVGKVTAGTVSRWEGGKMLPTQAHFRKIVEMEREAAKKQAVKDAEKQPVTEPVAIEGASAAEKGSEGTCHCQTCQRIDRIIQGLERRKQLLLHYKECVHSGLSEPLS